MPLPNGARFCKQNRRLPKETCFHFVECPLEGLITQKDPVLNEQGL